MRLGRLFFSGFVISFLGSLPLGTLNVAAFQISVSAGISAAIWFALGCVLVEVVYVRISLVAMNRLMRYRKVLGLLSIFAVAVTIFLALASFMIAFKAHAGPEKLQLVSSIPPFFLGLFMSAINPAQIPFWFGFSAVLLSKKILLPLAGHYNIYIGGIAAGSMIASFLFIFGGQIVLQRFSASQALISLCTGICFSIAAAIQLWRGFRSGWFERHAL